MCDLNSNQKFFASFKQFSKEKQKVKEKENRNKLKNPGAESGLQPKVAHGPLTCLPESVPRPSSSGH
jgi:hypothetical protein